MYCEHTVPGSTAEKMYKIANEFRFPWYMLAVNSSCTVQFSQFEAFLALYMYTVQCTIGWVDFGHFYIFNKSTLEIWYIP
jgi:hypothetical protein